MTAPRWDEPGPTPSVAPTSVSGTFRVDPDRIDNLLGQLRGVIDEVRRLERSLEPYSIASPGADAVSLNGARQANVMVERARSYIAEWHRQLVRTQNALERQKDSYVAADVQARA